MNLRESVWKGDHEGHIAGKGFNSFGHYNLVHKIILMPLAMKIPDAKAPVDTEWEKLENLPTWQMTEIKIKKRSFWKL